MLRSVVRRLAFAACCLGVVFAPGCGGGARSSASSPTGPTTPTPAPTPTPTPTPNPTPTPTPAGTLSAAGDIGWCGLKGAELTGQLLDSLPGPILVLGDVAYMDGSEKDYANCYEPHWGRHKARTFPVPGNHDYVTANAAPYFAYFGANAGAPGLGYYSTTLGAWHLVGLNTIIPIGEGSAQLAWLKQDLAANPAKCTLAYWHHPRYSSGQNGDSSFVGAALRVLYDAGVEIVLNAHDHVYERMTPVDPDGRPDAAKGVRQFTVGTGGAKLYSFTSTKSMSDARAAVWGVLRLTLASDGYEWEFLAVPGESYRDSGFGHCH